MVGTESLFKTDYISCLDGYNNSRFTIHTPSFPNYHCILNTWELISLLLNFMNFPLILLFRFIIEITSLLRFHFV